MGRDGKFLGSSLGSGLSLTLDLGGRHHTIGSRSSKSPLTKNISGVFFVLKHWISKHYNVSLVVLIVLLVSHCVLVCRILKLMLHC